MTSMIVVTVAHRSIKIVNRRLRLHVVGFVTLLSSDKNNQLLSGSQPAPRGGESLASPHIVHITTHLDVESYIAQGSSNKIWVT